MLYTRDLNGRITTIKDTIGHTMHYAYDANGNRTRSTDPNGHFIDYTVDPKQNTIATVTRYMDNGDKVTYTMEDDSNTGRVLKGTDALGNTTHYTYTSSVEDKTIADPLGNTTTLLHDLARRITQATDLLA